MFDFMKALSGLGVNMGLPRWRRFRGVISTNGMIPPGYMTARAAARRLGVARCRVVGLAEAGLVPAKRYGQHKGGWAVDARACAQWLLKRAEEERTWRLPRTPYGTAWRGGLHVKVIESGDQVTAQFRL